MAELDEPMITLTYLGFHGHTVKCSGCGYTQLRENTADAVHDYISHGCPENDPEEFCPECYAGTESSQHFEICGGA